MFYVAEPGVTFWWASGVSGAAAASCEESHARINGKKASGGAARRVRG